MPDGFLVGFKHRGKHTAACVCGEQLEAGVMKIQQLADVTPSWANWLTIAGSAALAWIQPIAGLVAIVWGCLQIWSWFERRKNRKE